MVTIKQISEQTGFSASTVSYALRDNPRIPEETRERIKAAAVAMGYQRDAHLGQLMSYLKGRGQRSGVCPVVWVNTTTDPKFWHEIPWAREFYESAQQACKRLGLALSDLWVHDPSVSFSRIDDILKARGVRGLLLSTPLKQQEWAQWIDWNAYATVVLDDPFALPQFDRVFAQYSWNMRIAIEQLLSRGYRRPKLWLSEQDDYWTGYGYTQECLRQNQLRPGLDAILTPYSHSMEPAVIRAWLDEHRPDVVVAPTPTLGKAIEGMGFQIPRQLGYLAMYVPNGDSRWSGISQLHMQQAVIAVDRIATLLQANTIGRQNYPQQIQVRGEWREGTTLRAPEFAPLSVER
jgi:LacI family transcriptional regulator